MSATLVIRPIARLDLAEGATYYELRDPGLGEEFIQAVQEVIDEIVTRPRRYPIVLRDIREAIMSRFPYTVYYRALADRIVVIAVFHHSRDPKDWQSRS